MASEQNAFERGPRFALALCVGDGLVERRGEAFVERSRAVGAVGEERLVHGAAAFALGVRGGAIEIRMNGCEHGVRSDPGHVEGAFAGQKPRFRQAHRAAFEPQFRFFERREATEDDEIAFVRRGRALDHRLQYVVFALRVGGVEPVEAARIDAHPELGFERSGAPGDVHFEDFRRARRGEKNRPRRMFGNDRGHERAQAGQRIGPAQIVLVEDRRSETRLREDHDAERGLEKALARAGPDDEKKAVLHLVMQPTDRRERTKIVALDNVRLGFVQAGAPESPCFPYHAVPGRSDA
jgi:hypothetical protein